MAQMIELAGRISRYYNCILLRMPEKMLNMLNRDTEDIKDLNQILVIKIIICEMKNILDGCKSRLYTEKNRLMNFKKTKTIEMKHREKN